MRGRGRSEREAEAQREDIAEVAIVEELLQADAAPFLGLGLATALGAQDIRTEGELVSKAPTGPPLAVSSSEVGDNLNADQVDGLEGGDLVTQAELLALQQQLAAVAALVGLTQKVVFVTSEQFSGNLGGINGAVAACNDAARAAGLFGFFRPWLGDPSSTFVQADVPYVRTDGVMVAVDCADLTDDTNSLP